MIPHRHTPTVMPIIMSIRSSGVISASCGDVCLQNRQVVVYVWVLVHTFYLREGLLGFAHQRFSYGTPHASAIAERTRREVHLSWMTMLMISGVTPRYSAKATKVKNPLSFRLTLMNSGLFSFFSFSSLVLLIMNRLYPQYVTSCQDNNPHSVKSRRAYY